MSNNQYKNSITLQELVSKLEKHLQENPGDANKPVYHDCLSMVGDIESGENFLELI